MRRAAADASMPVGIGLCSGNVFAGDGHDMAGNFRSTAHDLDLDITLDCTTPVDEQICIHPGCAGQPRLHALNRFKREKVGITFKANQPGLHIYTRKYYHNFKVAITSKNFEGSVGLNLKSISSYLMAEKTQIGMYDQYDFTPSQTWSIPTKSLQDQDIEILFMTVSADEERIGVALGRKLTKGRKQISEIAIYKRDKKMLASWWNLEKLKDFEYFGACI